VQTDDREAAVVSLALTIAFLATIDGHVTAMRVWVLVALPFAGLAYWRLRRVSIVLAYLVASGFVLRLAAFPPGGFVAHSDALRGISEAITTALAGGNPYHHLYTTTDAPYQSVAYTPALFLLHLPGQVVAGLAGVQMTQILAAGVVMITLAAFVRQDPLLALPALAIYALLPILVTESVGGTNDTAVGAAALIGALVLGWAVRAPTRSTLILAGIVLALTFGTKQTVMPVAFVLLAYIARTKGWRPAALIAVAAAASFVAISLPFLAMGPGTYVRSLLSELLDPKSVYGWNIWNALKSQGITFPSDVTTAGTVCATLAAFAVAVAIRWRTYGEAILAGCAVSAVLLVTTRWTSAGYMPMLAGLAFVGPMLLLRLPAWGIQQAFADTPLDDRLTI
jgi:hypothetical protein